MNNCVNCSNKCFEYTSGKCVSYNGESFPNLNVIQNNNIDTVIQNLSQSVSDLKDYVEKCSVCNNESATNKEVADFSYITNSQTYSNFHEINVSTKPLENTINVSYSIPEFSNDVQILNSDISIKGKKNGYSAEVYSSKNLIDGVSLQPDNFPAILISKIKILTNDGERILESKLDLDPTGKNTTTSFSTSNFNQNTPENQNDFNKLILQRLESLESSFKTVSRISSSYFNGSTQEALLDLYSKLNTTNSKLDAPVVTNPVTSKENSLQNIINDLYATIDILNTTNVSTKESLSNIGSSITSITNVINSPIISYNEVIEDLIAKCKSNNCTDNLPCAITFEFNTINLDPSATYSISISNATGNGSILITNSSRINNSILTTLTYYEPNILTDFTTAKLILYKNGNQVKTKDISINHNMYYELLPFC